MDKSKVDHVFMVHSVYVQKPAILGVMADWAMLLLSAVGECRLQTVTVLC